MKTLVLYDSKYGNTKIVAAAIGDAIGQAVPGEVDVLHVGEVAASEIGPVDLFILGSPTHGAMPSEAVQTCLAAMGPPKHEGARAATFDTRLTWPFLERWGGFAASKMADALEEKGWTLLGEPAGIYVKGLFNVHLKKGELERAVAWAKELVAATA